MTWSKLYVLSLIGVGSVRARSVRGGLTGLVDTDHPRTLGCTSPLQPATGAPWPTNGPPASRNPATTPLPVRDPTATSSVAAARAPAARAPAGRAPAASAPVPVRAGS